MRVPEAVVIPCVVVIRFFPTIAEDYRQIRNAMALRGIASGGWGLVRHPAQSLEYILIPLLMNSAETTCSHGSPRASGSSIPSAVSTA